MNPNVKRADDEGLGWHDLGGIYRRKYDTYEVYLEKQGEKLDSKYGFCRKRNEELKLALQSRLKALKIVEHGMSVLCLGARLGGEVEAFLKMGAFAVGLDVNPGQGNRYVVYGDFQFLQFPDNSTVIIYMNCFDHCLEPEKVLAEVRRVLKPDGIFVMECKAGSNEDVERCMGSDRWDCLEWDSMKVLVGYIEQAGFSMSKSYKDKKVKSHPFGYMFRKAL